MKVIHTSDWHLGKKLFRVDRIPEQEKFLQWLLETADQEEIDLICISGDIFDTPHPPIHAIETWHEFLAKVCKTPSLSIVAMGGNHDSLRFIQSSMPLLDKKRIHIAKSLQQADGIDICRIPIKGQELIVGILPYFTSHELLNWIGPIEDLEESNIETQFYRKLQGKLISEGITKDAATLLMGHHLYGKFQSAGSEQVVGLSGIDSIDPRFFSPYFQYLALGHIHRYQTVCKESPQAVYCGSPIPMRFSEKTKKKIQILEFEQARMTNRSLEIPEFRKLYQIQCDQDNWKQQIQELDDFPGDNAMTPLVEVNLTLDQPTHGLNENIRGLCEDKGLDLLLVNQIIKGSESKG